MPEPVMVKNTIDMVIYQNTVYALLTSYSFMTRITDRIT